VSTPGGEALRENEVPPSSLRPCLARAARRRDLAPLEREGEVGYSSQMKRATLTDAKNNLRALVDQVQHGETILILDQGRPVARLESVRGEGDDPEGRLARLERQGLLRRGSAPLPREILMARPLRPSEGASALEALLAERRDGR